MTTLITSVVSDTVVSKNNIRFLKYIKNIKLKCSQIK